MPDLPLLPNIPGLDFGGVTGGAGGIDFSSSAKAGDIFGAPINVGGLNTGGPDYTALAVIALAGLGLVLVLRGGK